MKCKAKMTPRGNVFRKEPEELVRRNRDRAMEEAVMLLERAVKEKTPTGVMGAQGGLLASIAGEVKGKGSRAVKGIVATAHKYGEVVEKGREAGKPMPPKGSLVRWIELKFGVNEEAAQRIEFVVRRKIGRKGFEGAQMFEQGLDESWDTMLGIFERAGFDIAREMEH